MFSLTGSSKSYSHPGATLVGYLFAGVTQFDATAVFLDDAPDNREPKPRALFPCRNVRLEQPAAVRLGKADTVVHHVDHDIVAVAFRKYADHPLAEFPRRDSRDCLGGILDDVGECLRDQPSVKSRRHGIFNDTRIDIDF